MKQKNRRKVLFIYKPIQILILKVIFVCCTLSVVSVLLATVMFYVFILELYTKFHSDYLYSLILLLKDYKYVYFLHVFVGIIFSIGLIIFAWLKLSHKIAGPLYRMRQNLSEYVNDQDSKYKTIVLRKDDEMQDLAQFVNKSIEKNVTKNRDKGFSLIEVLIAVGIMSVLSAGLVSIISNTMKSQSGVLAKNQQQEVTTEIRSLLLDKKACLQTFGNAAVVNGTKVQQIKNANGVAIYTVGSKDKSNLLMMNEFRLDHFIVEPNDPNIGRINLIVKMSKVATDQGVREIRPEELTLKVKFTAGEINECFYIGADMDGLWKREVASSAIYFPDGHIGIGIANPKTAVDVNGEIRALGGAGACNADTFGAFHYNTTKKYLECCNGVTWGACYLTYSWQTDSFGSCSAECGVGTQTRNVTCMSSQNIISDVTLCSAGTKPANSQSCNTQACAPPPPENTYEKSCNAGECTLQGAIYESGVYKGNGCVCWCGQGCL